MKIIFLDEPSTGMDPVTKRKMWDLISELKKKHAILLTTHSMEEADALCTRIGIMVSGSLRCLGSSQHLKDKYGSTYSLSLKTNESNVSNLSEFVKKNFPNAKLLSEFSSTQNYEIPMADIQLPQVFNIIEENKKSLEISDYSFSQTTLEQVFLKFANQQINEDARA